MAIQSPYNASVATVRGYALKTFINGRTRIVVGEGVELEYEHFQKLSELGVVASSPPAPKEHLESFKRHLDEMRDKQQPDTRGKNPLVEEQEPPRRREGQEGPPKAEEESRRDHCPS